VNQPQLTGIEPVAAARHRMRRSSSAAMSGQVALTGAVCDPGGHTARRGLPGREALPRSPVGGRVTNRIRGMAPPLTVAGTPNCIDLAC
jgi:hypothetical protein